jgi:ABC-type polysaccharide/polyol phosphate export permease
VETAPGTVIDSATGAHPIDDEFSRLLRHRAFVVLWARRNISLRYKRSVLGVLWTVLEPLLIISILAVVFSTLFRFEVPNYPIYILSGWVVWDFFSRATSMMAQEIEATRDITSRFRVPRSAFLVASILSHLFNWCVAMLVLAAMMVVLDQPFTPALLAVPFGMALTIVFAFGVGCVVATLATLFHDFGLMWSVVLTMWLYATPIIYPMSIVPEPARPFLQANPMTHMLELVRGPIHRAQLPPASAWMTGLSIAMMAAIAGIWVLTRARAAMEHRA